MSPTPPFSSDVISSIQPPYSSMDTAPTQQPLHFPIWKSRQGLTFFRRMDSESILCLQERRG